VLYAFTSIYGNVSPTNVAERYRFLVVLAAPPLASQLRAARREALTAVGGIVHRVRLDCVLLRLQLTAPSEGLVHGSVTIEQWPAGAGESTVPPVRSSYAADLVQVHGGWRVSEFRLVS
jgi:hypothetical protein